MHETDAYNAIMEQLMNEIVAEVERNEIEERKCIKKLAMSNVDSKSWSRDQVDEAIELLEKHLNLNTRTDLHHLIYLQKKLLEREPKKCYELGEKLLALLSSRNECSDKRIPLLRNHCYTSHWNYMRLTMNTTEIGLTVGICFLALRFSLTHSVTNLGTVVNRLKQMTHVIQKINSVKLLLQAWDNLVETLRNCLAREFGGGKALCGSVTGELEENFVQLLLILSRQSTVVCPWHAGVNQLVAKIQKIAQNYIPTLRVDLTASHMMKTDGTTTLYVLAEYLDKHRSILTTSAGIFDVFEYNMSWNSWSKQWINVKKERPELETKNVYDLLSHDKMTEDYKIFLCQALRCEINAYFCSSAVQPDGLIGAGQALEDLSTSYVDMSIGALVQGIGFWFGHTDEHEKFALDLCMDAVETLNDKAPSNNGPNISALIVSSVAFAWTGFCTLKRLQTRAVKELKEFEEYDKQANPSLYKDSADDDEGSRSFPGISSVSLKDEFNVATWLKKSANTMYKLTQLQDKFTEELRGVCPSMVLITMRLVAHTLTSFGDHISSIKAWQVVRTLSVIEGNRLSTLFSGAELMKQFPHLNLRLALEIEADFQSGWAVNETIRKKTKPYLLRYNLSRATIAFHNKDYQIGLNCLDPIMQYRYEKDNYDISHHLMAETYFLLSQYRALDPALNIDFRVIPKELCDLSPVSLATKAFTHLTRMTRPLATRKSGWSDMLHNSFLLSTIMQIGPEIIKLLRLNGRVHEMHYFAADFLFLTQQLAYVSRSAQCLISLAESDMVAKQFDSAEMKIMGLNSILSREPIELTGSSATPLPSKSIIETLQKYGIDGDHERLTHFPDVCFAIKSVKMRDSHYAKGDQNVDKSLLVYPFTHFFKTPSFLFHSLQCNCYLCSHPTIIPVTIQYFLLLGNYSMYSKDSVCAKLMEAASRHHLRGMFRILHNTSLFMADFSHHFTQKEVKSAMDKVYLSFFSEPTAKSLQIQMVLCPPENILFTVQAHKNYLELCNLVNPEDLVTKQESFDRVVSSLFVFLFQNDYYEIRGSKIKETSKQELVKISPSIPDAVTPLRRPKLTPRCPPAPRKGLRPNTRAFAGALNDNAKSHADSF